MPQCDACGYDLLQLSMKDLTRICAADVSSVGNDISRLRGFVDSSYAQFALLGVQLMWTTDVQSALEQASAPIVSPENGNAFVLYACCLTMCRSRSQSQNTTNVCLVRRQHTKSRLPQLVEINYCDYFFSSPTI